MIEAVLKQHEPKIRMLLHQYRVLGGVNMETINKAQKRHGTAFMMKLMKIVTPQSDESAFNPLINMATSPQFYETIDYAQKQQQKKNGGKFFSFWDNLLNQVGKTGDAVGEFRNDINGNQQAMAYQTSLQQNKQQKTVFLIAGAIVLVIILVLLFKN